MEVNVYLFFDGRCEEAIQFYQQAVGAKPDMLMRFRESPTEHPPGMVQEGWDDKVMHASFTIGKTMVMASDGCGPQAQFKNFSLSLTVADQQEAERCFKALSEGGKVTMPLDKTFWSPCFGMLEDKFGLGWMISVEPTN
ncbi:VOC family protein [Uliginosibacterium sp. H1]|uniref:VOC family protein n=1 Tax=Uliginosibacterium sp. H1 TaxID=3114757 RepID=UPI002E16C514|nr:VOC family protein [Uliginosibacterium sp. H1]